MTGHARGDRVQTCPQAICSSSIREFIRQIGYKAVYVRFAEHCRRCANRNCTGAETFDGQAKPVKSFRVGSKPVAVFFRKVDDLGNKQGLCGNRPFIQAALESFVYKSLMGRVLVYDDKTVGRLGDNVVLVDLGACRAERTRLQTWIRQVAARTRIAAGYERFEAGLGGFGKLAERTEW